MAFNYTPKTWKNGPTGGTQITADELTRIDTGVKLAGDIADTAVTPDQLATALDNKAAGLAGATGAFGGVYPSEAAIRAAYPNLGQGEKNTVFFVPEVN